MFKHAANTAIDLKIFGNSKNSNVNSDALIRRDNGGDPTPGANSVIPSSQSIRLWYAYDRPF